MIAMDSTQEHPATSLSNFFASHVEQYKQMLKVGDIADRDESASKIPGRPTVERAEQIENEVCEMIEMIAMGETVAEVARRQGLPRPVLAKRLHTRGLSVAKIRERAADEDWIHRERMQTWRREE